MSFKRFLSFMCITLSLLFLCNAVLPDNNKILKIKYAYADAWALPMGASGTDIINAVSAAVASGAISVASAPAVVAAITIAGMGGVYFASQEAALSFGEYAVDHIDWGTAQGLADAIEFDYNPFDDGSYGVSINWDKISAIDVVGAVMEAYNQWYDINYNDIKVSASFSGFISSADILISVLRSPSINTKRYVQFYNVLNYAKTNDFQYINIAKYVDDTGYLLYCSSVDGSSGYYQRFLYGKDNPSFGMKLDLSNCTLCDSFAVDDIYDEFMDLYNGKLEKKTAIPPADAANALTSAITRAENIVFNVDDVINPDWNPGKWKPEDIEKKLADAAQGLSGFLTLPDINWGVRTSDPDITIDTPDAGTKDLPLTNGSIFDILSSLLGSIISNVANLWNMFKNFWSQLGSILGGVLDGLISFLRSLFIIDDVAVANAFADFFNPLRTKFNFNGAFGILHLSEREIPDIYGNVNISGSNVYNSNIKIVDNRLIRDNIKSVRLLLCSFSCLMLVGFNLSMIKKIFNRGGGV